MGDRQELGEQRVFQIDRECYVVFIGTSIRDVRPFLRIGNTTEFPQAAAGEIRDVVITDRLTGNPLFEADSVSNDREHQLRYLGDPDIVERFKEFVGVEDLQIEAFETYTVEESPPEKHALVYFYKSGNMSVYYGADKIFALEDREKRDLHFVEKARRIKNEHLRDPLRFQKSSLSGPGIIRCGRSLFYFRNGKLVGDSLQPDFFRSLARSGIDPDQVHIWMVDSASNDEVVRLFKRARSKRASLSVVGDDLEPLQKLSRLFSSGVEGGSFKVDVHGADASITVFGDKITANESRSVHVEGRDLPGAVELVRSRRDLSSAATISASAEDTPTILVRWNDDDHTIPLLHGVPYTFSSGIPTEKALASSYLSVWTPVLRDLIPAQEMPLVDQLEAFFARRPQGQGGDKALKALESRIRTLRRPTVPGPLRVFLHNAAVIARIIAADAGSESSRGISQLADQLARVVPSLDDEAVAAAPSVATILFGGHGVYALYRPLSATMSSRNIAFSNEVREQVASAATVDTEVFERDRRALVSLIDRLRARAGRPTSGARAAGAAAGAAGAAAGTSAAGAAGTAASEKSADTGDSRGKAGKGKTDAEGGASDADRKAAAAAGNKSAGGDGASGAAEGAGGAAAEVAGGAAARSGDGAGTNAAASAAAGGVSGSGSVSGSGGTGGSGGGSGERRSGSLRWIAVAALLLLALGLGYLFSPLGDSARSALSGDGARVVDGEVSGDADDGGSSDGERGSDDNGGSDAGADNGGSGDSADDSANDGASGDTAEGTNADEDEPAEAEGEPSDSEETENDLLDLTDEELAEEIENLNVALSFEDSSVIVDQGVFESIPEVLRQDRAFEEINISVFDIIRVTNRIAVDNGYRRLGADSDQGEDPNWIFPENELTLPDGTMYVVQPSDNMWNLASEFIRRDVAEKVVSYLSLFARVDLEALSADDREYMVSELVQLRDGAYSRELAERFDQAIRDLET